MRFISTLSVALTCKYCPYLMRISLDRQSSAESERRGAITMVTINHGQGEDMPPYLHMNCVGGRALCSIKQAK